MQQMFKYAERFDYPLNWDLTNVTNTYQMFYGAGCDISHISFINYNNLDDTTIRMAVAIYKEKKIGDGFLK